MSKRVCAECGEEKDVSGGKVCVNSHFICKGCIMKDVGIFSGAKQNCPLCGKKLT